MSNLVAVPGAPLDLYSQASYVIKRPWSFFERRFFVFAPDGRKLLFVKHPVFKLREEFNIFTDESERVPVLRVKARQVVALDRVHDVFDALTGEPIGSLRRHGWKSIVRDVWDLIDGMGQVVGQIEEQGSTILRRFLPFLTSKHRFSLQGQELAFLRQQFRFFTKEFHLTLGPGRADPRFLLAGALLAVMAEAQREDRG